MVEAERVFTHERTHRNVSDDECRRLLRTQRLGRVALSVASLPAVLPVLYRVVGRRIVFAIDTPALFSVLSGNVVAFEVDCVDLPASTGWTVLVVGRCRAADDLDPSVVALADHRRPDTGAAVAPDRLMAISVDRISGSRTVA
jgi:nitroimidazol reductase NimA-like FMN-containing flavoprotein (pyridoxamine 5'-phosphate oxidase superfamily)